MPIIKTCEIIVSRCASGQNGWHTYGESVRETRAGDSDRLRQRFAHLCAPGFAIIVRPTYNDSPAPNFAFHEWRSFNGEPFKRVDFK